MSTPTVHLDGTPYRPDLSFEAPPSKEKREREQEGEGELVGSSAAMRRLRLQVHRIGPHFRTVLVRGEAGTGKALVAKALHRASHCANGPFVARPAARVEGGPEGARGEGHASSDTLGSLIKMAQLGTLFLDEIGEMPPQVQAGLLRVLKRNEHLQSHADTPQRQELRVIASTSKDLRCLVAAGHLRQDLYQRLAMVEITLPPLRERLEDIGELARYLLHRLVVRDEHGAPAITDEVMERLRGHSWPGNVRELEEVLRSAVLRSERGVVEQHHLPEFAVTSMASHNGDSGASVRLEDVVEQHVLRVLKDCRGNKLRAAEMLGISRSTLYRMLEAGAAAEILR
jgi:DNA-binding NtrC family response regulator